MARRYASASRSSGGSMTEEKEKNNWASHIWAIVIIGGIIFFTDSLGGKKRDADGHTPLSNAVYSDNIWLAKWLIFSGADINAPNSLGSNPLKSGGGWTPLHYAVATGNKRMVKLLIDKGAYVDSRENENKNSLYLATSLADVEMVKLLLSEGSDPNLKSDFGTPLHLAASCNDIERFKIAQELLKNKAYTDFWDQNGYTPLITAINGKNERMVELLLENGANANLSSNDGTRPLQWAFINKDQYIIDMLKEHHATIPQYR
jgi:uncharacterized protein